MNEQALNTRIDQYLSGIIDASEFSQIKQKLANNKTLKKRVDMSLLVEDYVDGSLSGRERRNFEQYLAKDPFLKEKVDIYQSVVIAIQQEGAKRLRKRFAALDAELDKAYEANQVQLEAEYQASLAQEKDFLSQIELDKDGNFVTYHENGKTAKIKSLNPKKRNQKQVATKRGGVIKQMNRFLARAAAILLLLGIPAYLYLSAQYSTDSIFNQYYQNYTPTAESVQVVEGTSPEHADGGSVDDDTDQTKDSDAAIIVGHNTKPQTNTSTSAQQMPTNLERARLAAEIAYNDQNYHTATRLFKQLKSQQLPKNYQAQAQFYLALSLLADNQAAEALPLLIDNVGNSPQYQPHNQWYLGLAQLKTGHHQQAQQTFAQLATTNSLYTQKAKDIIQALNRQSWLPF